MASIADVFVTVLPETSRLATGIQRALRDVDSGVRAAAKRWQREIDRELSGKDVEVTADTKPARKELDKLEKEKHTATVDVDADTAAAEAQIDAVARDRKATIEVDVDKSSVARAQSLIGGGGGGRGGGLGGSLSGAAKLEGVIGRNLIGAQHRSRDRLRGQRGRLTVGRVGVAARGGRSEKCTGDTPLLKPTRPVILPGDEGGPILCRAPKAAEAIAELITMLIGFRTQSLASMTAALASAIESTIESGFGALLRDFIEKTSGT